jgi:carbonic anhydrase/acetyltransferase-like protein (isoleucine patch superfamily)
VERTVTGRRRVPFDGHEPQVDPTAFVADDATLVGRTEVGPEASIWYAAVVRADGDRITVGPGSNVQDGCVLHADPGLPLTIGRGVTVGHRVVLHGCTVEDDTLVGMGAVVLNGARIGSGCLVAAGTVVLEGTDVPPGSLVAGVPGKVRRPVTDEERASIRANADGYRRRAQQYAAG